MDDIRKLKTQHNYQKIADLYTQDFSNDRCYFTNIDKALEIVNNLVKEDLPVVDLGTGPGTVSDYLLEKGEKRLDLVEFAPAFCEILKLKYQRKHDIKVCCDDMLYYLATREPDSIKAMFAIYSIIHVPEEEVITVFKYIRRALVSGGIFCFSVFKGDFKGMEQDPYQVANDGRLKVESKIESYLNNFTESELKSLLNDAGFKLLSLEEYNDDSEVQMGGYPNPKLWLIAQK